MQFLLRSMARHPPGQLRCGSNNLGLRTDVQLPKQAKTLSCNLGVGAADVDGDRMIRLPQSHAPEQLFLSGR